MTRFGMLGNLFCMAAASAGLAIIVPELLYYAPMETGLYTAFLFGFAYALTNILKCVR